MRRAVRLDTSTGWQRAPGGSMLPASSRSPSVPLPCQWLPPPQVSDEPDMTNSNLDDLARDQVLDDLAHESHWLDLVEGGQRHGGTRQQIVTRQNRQLVSHRYVEGLETPTGGGSVYDVVVEEAGDVDHLCHLRNPLLPPPDLRRKHTGGASVDCAKLLRGLRVPRKAGGH